jgi:hypothetical protein
MSRSAGPAQASLLEIIGTREVPLPTLIWEGATRDKILDADNLPEESYKLIHGAARRLAGRTIGDAVVTVRNDRIATLDELVSWYPDRAKDGLLRRLRQQLLPHILGFAKQSYGMTELRKVAVACEDRVLRDAHEREHLLAVLRQIEDGLLRELSGLDGAARTDALVFVARARAVASSESCLHADVTLLAALKKLSSAYGAGPLDSLLAELLGYLPVRDIQRAKLRKLIGRAASMKRHAPVGLKPPFKDYLLQVAPDVIRALPGHQQRASGLGHRGVPHVAFDAILDQLLQRDVYKEFRIYSATAGTTP